MSSALQKETETFDAKKKELLARGEGKFVLIKGDRVVGLFDSQGDTLQEGYRLFGRQPFLVKQVLALDVPLPFASPLIGV